MRQLRMVALALALATGTGCGGCDVAGLAGDSGAAPDGAVFNSCAAGGDCGWGPECGDGGCATCHGDGDCGDGAVCLDGQCLQACPASALRCEAGGSCCPGDYDCVGTTCMPPCDGERCGRSGELCCGSEQICYGFVCTEPGVSCSLPSECAPDEVCEVDLGLCVSREAIGTCQYHPPRGVFAPVVECRWAPGPDALDPTRVDVVMAPVVMNLTDDNGDGATDAQDTPEVVFTSYDLDVGCCNVAGTLRVVSGACEADGSMRTLASVNEPPIDNSGGLALGDLDGDGVPEIVAITIVGGHPQGTAAFRRAAADGSAWELLWHNTEIPTWNVHTRGGAQPALADLDRDGRPEVIVGNAALDGEDGHLLWDGLVTSGGQGGIGNNAFLGPVSTVADVDLDGQLEVLAGNTCYGPDGTIEWSYTYTDSASGCGGQMPCDGFTASADLDGDAQGEVIIVRLGEVLVLQHDGTLLFKARVPHDDCVADDGTVLNEAGPPTVADFDGDGRPEIGTAAADFYAVIDLDCVGVPLPEGCESEGVLWSVPNRDCSSRVTASSVFDFEGDGAAEVIYADERSFRILDGATGQTLFDDTAHRSHTRLEMAVIADVDNDGNAEVLIAENRSSQGTPGVVVWGDSADNWVFTRRVWNQHSYHVSNIGEDGAVPAAEPANWQQPYLNNFRQNVQGEGLFWAPDLVLEHLAARCLDDDAVEIGFDVVNQGSRGVGPGVWIAVRIDASLAGTVRTTRGLLPGQREALSLRWEQPEGHAGMPFAIEVRVDDDGAGQGAHNECEDGGEDNNAARLAEQRCGRQL